MEWTPFFTMTAADTVVRLFLQLSVMVFRQFVSRFRQIVIFIDQSDVQSSRTRLTVITGNADALR